MRPSSLPISLLHTPSESFYLALSLYFSFSPAMLIADLFTRLLELGVPTAQLSAYIPLMKTEDQPKIAA